MFVELAELISGEGRICVVLSGRQLEF